MRKAYKKYAEQIKQLKLEIEKEKLNQLSLENELKMQKPTKQTVKTKDINTDDIFY